MTFRTVLMVLGLTLWTTVASAGTLTVRDSQTLFSPDDVSALQTDAKDWPFDLHLLVESAGSFQQLEDDAHNWVDGPNVVVVALDPQHHKTVARFGTSTGVKTGDFDTIAKAGNTHFRAREWKQGIEAIATRTQASVQAKQAITASSDPVVVQQGLSTGTWVCIWLLVASVAGIAVWMWRRAKREREQYERALDENRLETSELRSRNIRDQAWEDKLNSSTSRRPYTAPTSTATATPEARGQSTVVVNNVSTPSTADFTTGYVLGSLSHDHDHAVVREREVVRETPVTRYAEPTPSYSSRSSSDSGGSSSSWSGSSSSYGSSSSSSYDSGGSSSSFDWGGSSSFDSGGGGFDGGGGGSDW